MRRRISVLPYGPPAATDVDHASYRALRGDVSFRSDPLASRNRTLGHKRTLAPGAGLIATALAAIASWVIFSAINGFATSGMPGSTPSEMILVLVQLLSFYKRYRYGTSECDDMVSGRPSDRRRRPERRAGKPQSRECLLGPTCRTSEFSSRLRRCGEKGLLEGRVPLLVPRFPSASLVRSAARTALETASRR